MKDVDIIKSCLVKEKSKTNPHLMEHPESLSIEEATPPTPKMKNISRALKGKSVKDLPKGVYIAYRTSRNKYLQALKKMKFSGDHFGVLDVGNNIFEGGRYMLLHVLGNTAKSAKIILQELPKDENWFVAGQVKDVSKIRTHVEKAMTSPANYNVFFNNCEHFVHKALTGRRVSFQSNRNFKILGASAGVVIAAGSKGVRGALRFKRENLSEQDADFGYYKRAANKRKKKVKTETQNEFIEDSSFRAICDAAPNIDTSVKGMPLDKMPKGIYIGYRMPKDPFLLKIKANHFGIIDVGNNVFSGGRAIILHVKADSFRNGKVYLQEMPKDEYWYVAGKVKNVECVRAAVLKAVTEPHNYNILTNNCEHFVYKILSGKKISYQSRRVYRIIAGATALTGTVIAVGARAIIKRMRGIDKKQAMGKLRHMFQTRPLAASKLTIGDIINEGFPSPIVESQAEQMAIKLSMLQKQQKRYQQFVKVALAKSKVDPRYAVVAKKASDKSDALKYKISSFAGKLRALGKVGALIAGAALAGYGAYKVYKKVKAKIQQKQSGDSNGSDNNVSNKSAYHYRDHPTAGRIKVRNPKAETYDLAIATNSGKPEEEPDINDTPDYSVWLDNLKKRRNDPPGSPMYKYLNGE